MAKAPSKTAAAAALAASAGAYDPLTAAVADGWAKHPDTEGFHYKGAEVLKDADVAALYTKDGPASEESNIKADGGNGGGASAPDGSESVADTATPPETDEQVKLPEGEVPSELKDQITPSGTNPTEVVQTALEQLTQRDGGGELASPAGTIVNAPGGVPTGEVPSELKDQVTPHGVDLGRLFSDEDDTDDDGMAEQMADLDEDEHREIEAEMRGHFKTAIERVRRRRVARSMELNLIDSTKHFGTAAEAALAANTTPE